jgi:hypothetical protein
MKKSFAALAALAIVLSLSACQENPTTPPIPPPSKILPHLTFTAVPAEIKSGESVQLTFRVSYCSHVSINNGVGEYDPPPVGQAGYPGYPAAWAIATHAYPIISTTYTATASNPDGLTRVSCFVKVNS